MDNEKERKRWPLTLIIIAAVVIVSAALIYSYRDSPSRLPLSAIGDGSGGVIIAWQNENGIYAQRVDASGRPLWGEDGLLVSQVQADFDIYGTVQTYFTLTADGTGGAVVTWEDRSQLPGDRDDPGYFGPVPVYSQRISSDGELLWGDGVATGKTRRIAGKFPQVVLDGTGGAVFAWNDYSVYHRGLLDDYLRLQKLAPDGTPLWEDEGVLVVASSPYRPITDEELASGIKGPTHRSRPTYFGHHTVVSDGASGMIVFWEEEEADNSNTIYAQRVNGEGNQVWPERVLVDAGQGCSIRSVISDGEGGAILAIVSNIPAATYLQHLSGNSELLWDGGKANIPSQYAPGMVGDGLGGVILFWNKADHPSGPPGESTHSLIVQRLNREGESIWQEKPVFTTEKGQYFSTDMTADGTGGAIIAWRLYREEFVAYGDILARRLDAGANTLWQEGGTVVFTDPDLKYKGTPVVINDSAGGAIIVAAVGKGALRGDMVYAQRLDIDGNRLWGSGIRIDR